MRVMMNSGCYKKYSDSYREKLELIDGLWVEIDTEFLFRNQLNTKQIPGVSVGGIRIYQDDIHQVEDDERIGRSKCYYCGAWCDTRKPCPSCDSGLSHMQEFFPGSVRAAKTVQEEMDDILSGSFLAE